MKSGVLGAAAAAGTRRRGLGGLGSQLWSQEDGFAAVRQSHVLPSFWVAR